MKLNDKQREYLKTPFSKPIRDDYMLLSKLNNYQYNGYKFIVIGDYSVEFFIKNGLPIYVGVVDFKTERKPISFMSKRLIKDFMKGYRCVELKNPLGQFTTASVDLVKQWVSKQDKLFIEVTGEEDIVALPFILLASNDYCVVYGLRDQGMIIKKLSRDFQRKVKNDLNLVI